MALRAGRRVLSTTAHQLASSAAAGEAGTAADARPACLQAWALPAKHASAAGGVRALSSLQAPQDCLHHKVALLRQLALRSQRPSRAPAGGAARYSSAASPSGAGFGTHIVYPPSQAFVGQPAPDFTAPAVVDGEISKVSLSNYKGQYVILFFYPKDFTFVCPTEIIAFSDRAKEFEDLNCQLMAASTDTEEVHLAWIKTPRNRGGLGHMRIPIIADTTKDIAARYGVLVKDAGVALRGLFIINPEGKIEQITINNMPIGRSVDEAKRLLQAIQFVAEHGEVCPADWKPGSKSMVADPDKSQDYFESQQNAEVDFGQKIRAVKSRQEFEQAINGDQPVVVDFYAPWCGKCRMIAPTLEELQDKHPNVSFIKVDTTDDRLNGLASELHVKALPAFRFYRGGQEALDQITGYKKKPLTEAVEKLAQA